ncbi:hypothetical protein BDD43_5144 [Mucilaginibacter gracilis]|uniref:Uncharacterized protein n=1 Tax=Mucilaginibacter gracilis TaxID=423350 RepID=A0A495J815_9SPHI|nr:hypothetical protein [Mucilaginibacter gracilis]RKR84891.1 hypothetical protein BDD43_5144 [Mucilaginibacter gracilis]
MDKQLYINILDVLQQSNAIDKMVDIKPAFDQELDTQEKRKNFKAQLDYLVAQGLIVTDGKYDFLGWQLLNGLYPVEGKKIEARLAGKWQSHIAYKRGVKGEPPIIPMAAPALAPVARLGLYDAPSAAPSLTPGVGPQQLAEPPLTAETDATPAANSNDDSDFLPFKIKNPLQARSNNSNVNLKPEYFAPLKAKAEEAQTELNSDNFLKEDDFLPFKNKTIPAEELEYENRFFREADFLPANTKRANAAAASTGNNLLNSNPFASESTGTLTAATPEPEKAPLPPAKIPEVPQEFSPLKVTYSPPRVDVKPMVLTAKPFKPAPVNTPPESKTAPVAPLPPQLTRPEPALPGAVTPPAATMPEPVPGPPIVPPAAPWRSMRSDPDEPILTARTASLLAAQPLPEPEAQTPIAAVEPEVVKELAQPKVVKFAPPGAPTPKLADAAPPQRNIVLPPPSNYTQMRFDTDNNPFADLSTIYLANDEDKPKTLNLATLLKWAIAIAVFMGLVLVYLLTKKRY